MATTRARKPAAKKPAPRTTATTRANQAPGTASKRPAAKQAPARKSAVRKVATGSRAKSPGKTVARKAVAKTARKPIAKKTAAVAKSPARKTAAAAARTGAKPQLRKTAGQQTTAKPAAAGKVTARKPGAGARQPRKITPKQALANTRALLEAKQQHDRQPQPWQTLDPQQSHLPSEGFQSPEAAAKAEELHAGESRMQAIQGSIGTQDRRNQGKRDKR